MGTTIVIGHLNPDTDNIAATIGITALLRSEGKEAVPYKKGNLNNETDWVLEYSNFKDQIQDLPNENLPEKQRVFLVDFNETAQAPVDLSKIKLVGLVDHHKLAGNWQTEEPIIFRVEPVGSSCTIVAKMFWEKNIAVSSELATLLLCGIISDTLNLSSPTTTEEDRQWVAALAKQSGGNVNDLADKLFEAKSDLSAFTPAEVVKLDYKVFTFGTKRIGIGVVETVKPENVKKIEGDLKQVLSRMKKEENLDLAYLGIVDILKKQTELLLISDEEKTVAMKSFSDIVISGDNLVLRGIVSRKKQIVPAMEKVVKEING